MCRVYGVESRAHGLRVRSSPLACVAGLIALTGCHVAGLLGPVPPCPARDMRVEGWTTIERPTFTFAIPPGYEQVVPEIGHYGGSARWVDSAGNVVGYMRGQFADDLRRYVYRPGFRSCIEEIGGRVARIVVYRAEDGRLFAGAHWASDGPSG